MPGLLEGKVGVIAGLSNKWGVAWGVAQSAVREGARLVFTHQERFADNARDLAAQIPGAEPLLVEDAADDSLLAPAFEQIRQRYGGLDFLIHSIAFASPDVLAGRFTDTKREDFQQVMDTNVYTMMSLARAAEPLFQERGGGSIVGFTYLGGERVVLGYKAMGVAKAAMDATAKYLAAELGPKNIRVNLVSAGPLRTAAGRGIPLFMRMRKFVEETSPLRRGIETADAGDSAVFLCSDLARNITGEILHVDAGYNTLGMWTPDPADTAETT
jgi:enoyl-[acyl-carrier protein] reductase I